MWRRLLQRRMASQNRARSVLLGCLPCPMVARALPAHSDRLLDVLSVRRKPGRGPGPRSRPCGWCTGSSCRLVSLVLLRRGQRHRGQEHGHRLLECLRPNASLMTVQVGRLGGARFASVVEAVIALLARANSNRPASSRYARAGSRLRARPSPFPLPLHISRYPEDTENMGECTPVFSSPCLRG